MNNTQLTRAEIDLLRRGYAECLLSSDRHMGPEEAATHAAARYPYPKVRRPRIVKAFSGEYKVEGGRMFTRPNCFHRWVERQYSCAEYQRHYATLLDLIANPTEEVDA